MYVFQNYGDLQLVSLQSECSGAKEELIHIYNPGKQTFLLPGKSGILSLHQMFANLLAEGTESSKYKAALMFRDFEFLHNEFMESLELKFLVKDLCMDKRYGSSRVTFHTVLVLEVTNVKRTTACLSDGTKKDTLHIHYRVEDTKTGEHFIRREDALIPMEKLAEAKEDEKIFQALRKYIDGLGVDSMGATLVYKDRAYKF